MYGSAWHILLQHPIKSIREHLSNPGSISTILVLINDQWEPLWHFVMLFLAKFLRCCRVIHLVGCRNVFAQRSYTHNPAHEHFLPLSALDAPAGSYKRSLRQVCSTDNISRQPAAAFTHSHSIPLLVIASASISNHSLATYRNRQ